MEVRRHEEGLLCRGSEVGQEVTGDSRGWMEGWMDGRWWMDGN